MKKLDHVGIAVSSIDAARGFYERMLGFTYMGDELVSGQNVRVAFLEAGGTKLELIEPLSDASPVSFFTEKRRRTASFGIPLRRYEGNDQGA